MDIEGNLAAFTRDRQPDARYASFDYCYNYFQSFREQGRAVDLAAPENMQVSCLQLGFYLASWGMLRGSSTLLRKSARHYEPVIKVIAAAPAEAWDLDADSYTADTWPLARQLDEKIRAAFGHPNGSRPPWRRKSCLAYSATSRLSTPTLEPASVRRHSARRRSAGSAGSTPSTPTLSSGTASLR